MAEINLDLNLSKKENNNNILSILKFVIPSVIGVLLFMTPIPSEGGITIPIAIVSNYFTGLIGEYLVYIIAGTLSISAIISLITKIFKPSFIINNNFLNSLFNVSTPWLITRVVGGVFGILTALEIGPEIIIGGSTGSFVFNDLLTILFSIFLFAGLFLPLLLNFGLLEFFGSLLTKIMRPVFKLPGRSSIDCITSWLGDGTLGIILTNKQ